MSGTRTAWAALRGAVELLALAAVVYIVACGILCLSRAYGQTPTPTAVPTSTATVPTWTPNAVECAESCNESATGRQYCPRGFSAGNQNTCERANIVVIRDNRGGFTCPDESHPDIEPEYAIFCDADPTDGVRWVFRAADGSWETQLDAIEAQIYLKQNNALIGQAHTIDFSDAFSAATHEPGVYVIEPGAQMSLFGGQVDPHEASDAFLLASTTARSVTVDNKLASTVVPTDAMTYGGPSLATFGGGTGGAVSLSDNPSSGTCSTCNAWCTGGCVWDSPVCECKLTPNSRWGAYDAPNKPSYYASLRGLYLGQNWRVTLDWDAKDAACASNNSAMGQIMLAVRGDATIAGTIDVRGVGGCSNTGGTVTNTANAGKSGQWTHLTGGSPGNNTGTAGTVGISARNLAWHPGSDMPMLAGGGAGAQPVASQISPRNPGPGYSRMFGGAGGGGGGCSAGATGTIVATGRGGGGLVMLVAGNLEIEASAVIDTRGRDGGTGSAGSGGGSALFLHGGTASLAGTHNAAGGTAGATVHANCGANGNGGSGQHVACNMRTGACTCITDGVDCDGY